ncbi:MAG: DUF4190 domain-containing protein [Planctomycetales bacterium]|nr:DUF4190 domain-containing protein [Planctomycetales bacterium]
MNTLDSTLAMPADSALSSDVEVYRSVSRSAITSLVLGVLGLGSFSLAFLVILPIAGLVFAIVAFSNFRRYPDELLGRQFAVAGAALCGFLCLAAPAYHYYIYMTEVPDGYSRADFAVLMSPKGRPDVPTDAAMELNGEPIFIKGYIHPTSMDTLRSKRFVLVPDLGTCCFGGQPPITHMIEVNIVGDQYATKNYRKQRLAGTFRVNPGKKPVAGLDGVYYQLRADLIK